MSLVCRIWIVGERGSNAISAYFILRTLQKNVSPPVLKPIIPLRDSNTMFSSQNMANSSISILSCYGRIPTSINPNPSPFYRISANITRPCKMENLFYHWRSEIISLCPKTIFSRAVRERNILKIGILNRHIYKREQASIPSKILLSFVNCTAL